MTSSGEVTDGNQLSTFVSHSSTVASKTTKKNEPVGLCATVETPQGNMEEEGPACSVDVKGLL